MDSQEPRNLRGHLATLRPRLVDRLTPAQQSLHNNFLVSVQTLKTGLVRSIYYLDRIRAHRIHRLLGYRTMAEYAAAYAGFTSSQTREFLYIARRLQDYPLVARALADGGLSWGKAREICSKVEPEHQEVWVDLARSLPRNQLREAIAASREEGGSGAEYQMRPADPSDDASAAGFEAAAGSSGAVSGANRGAPPPPVRQGDPKSLVDGVVKDRHFVTLGFSAEELARWESLIQKRREGGADRKEEVVLAGLNGGGGNSDGESPPPYLVVLLECPTCRKATMVTGRGEAPAPPPLIRAAACDRTVEDSDGKRSRAVAPRLRRLAMQRARFRCEADGCGRTQFLEIHHRQPVAEGGRNELENLVVLCWRCHRELHDHEELAKAAAAASPV